MLCLLSQQAKTELKATPSDAAAAKSLQSCPTLRNPIDSSPPGSAVPGILQAKTLEWVAIFFSSAWKWKVKVKSLSHARLFATPWTAPYQAPLSMWFSRQEYWSGVPLPSLFQPPTLLLFLIFSFLPFHLTSLLPGSSHGVPGENNLKKYSRQQKACVKTSGKGTIGFRGKLQDILPWLYCEVWARRACR